MAETKPRIQPAQLGMILTMFVMAAAMFVHALTGFHYSSRSQESFDNLRTADSRVAAAEATLNDIPVSEDVKSAIAVARIAALDRERVRIEELAIEKDRLFVMQMLFSAVFILFCLISAWTQFQTIRQAKASQILPPAQNRLPNAI